MRPCIAQVTTLTGSFADDIENYTAVGCRVFEVWLTKLEQHLESVSAAETRKLLADRGFTLAAAAYQGGLLLTEGERRQVQLDQFKRRLDLCAAFGIPTLVVVSDFAERPRPQTIGRAIESLGQVGEWAAAFGVRLALEFRATDAFCTCLDTAISLVEQCGQANVGICLDAFHYHKGPSKPEDLQRLTEERLFHVQVCDIAGVPRELMADAERIMPGEGEFHLAPIVQRLREIRYSGAVSLELMNPELWRANPKQLLELGLTSVERLLAAVP